MIKHLKSSEFESSVLNNGGLVLVDFFATWCGPCQMLGPVLEEISNSRANFDIAKVNIDEEIDLTRKYNIESVPTMLIFKSGKIVDTIVGYADKEEIVDTVNKYI